MSEQVRIAVDQFELVRQDIDGWRGRCLDVFSRSEAAIIETLLVARDNGRAIKLGHLAGQRLTELAELEESRATPRQAAALRKTLERWRELETKRPFLAHGVVTELIDRQGKWWAKLDIIVCEKAEPNPVRWTASQNEAADFETELRDGFAQLKGQLGHLQTRLAT